MVKENHPEAAAEYPAFFTGSNNGSDLGYTSSVTYSRSYLPVASPVGILTSGSSVETGDDVTNDEATSKTVNVKMDYQKPMLLILILCLPKTLIYPNLQ